MGIRKGTWCIVIVMSVWGLSSCSLVKKPVSQPASKSRVSLNSLKSTKARSYPTTPVSLTITGASTDLEKAQAWQFKYAQMLDVAVEEVNNYRLYGFIEDWWGTPYRMGGKNKEGIDCSGFVTTLMSVVFQLSFSGTSQQMYEHAKRLRSRSELQEGDLVFFSIGQKRVSHVGIYLDHDRFVHASSSAGVMISDLNEAYWTRYYTGAGRVE
ncbi:NlpC/P60 family protein [Chitinophaga agrisoli]|uniref:NlpC/P60 family protein n=1 Tax=Chitinophaga agrisoli TaxID=2607653 RepID=A0A5B2VKE1_9BACT|nr:C40 family peptidase [Chitinophaga agrisoli]KAA2239148.1 NlpC/P60 family protein [Chitinophaga agrisoli]